VWRHIGVELDAVTDYELTHYDLDDPPTSGPLGEVIRRLGELDEQNQPIPIMAAEGDREFGRVHYGRSTLVRELRLFPLLELSIVLIFIFLAVLGYRGIKDSEQRSVWVGMAKETAHQLGTPISSLMGWLEVLRDKIGDGDGEGPSVHVDREFLDDVIQEMENDTARLEKIAARFSNVGSVPRLTEQDIVPVVAEAARYLRRRLPHMGVKVQIHEQFEEVPKVNVNRELIEWVVENLLKNALDSVDRQTGEITLQVKRDAPTESVDVRVHDNGRGMTPAEQRQVFEPGFSTKRRGWGLGLSLSRRIIEEYHGGRISLESSVPGEGTVFIIRFPL